MVVSFPYMVEAARERFERLLSEGKSRADALDILREETSRWHSEAKRFLKL